MATTVIGGLTIEDLRNDLPLRTQYRPEDLGSLAVWDGSHWRYRPRNKPIDTITIHHTGGGSAWTIEQMVQWCVGHTESYRTWYLESPYHFLIEQNGRAAYCVDVSKRTWHCGAENDNAVGVSLMGNFVYGAEPPPVQIASAKRLLTALQTEFPNVGFRGHREMRDCVTTCPGQTWLNWRAKIIPTGPAFNWPALWGNLAPYNPNFGIPRAWREEYLQGREPGAAIGPERYGVTIQEFENAVILWVQGRAQIYYR
ncbi:MAG: peptidoglycan recognition protein family protein [Chloroflexi bacterium]|nr:peptidoglycan recognition protein family protein [Chloroflexota bacterium]MBU1747298.1 peptidoglycan recognition protein family protein [Chloroflexota bacterium]MBU1877333.1 peptidoglycan recognition protein family protein [Chloroflexota bacterium]